MTSTDARLRLRPPLWAQLWVAVFPPFFLCFFLFAVRPSDGPTWVGALVAAVLAPLLAWRLFRLAAIGTADGRLVVRNVWRDRTLQRDEIESVTVDRAYRGRGSTNQSVYVVLRDGTRVRLDVTEVPFRTLFGGRLERDAEAVREWVAGRPQPFL